jgi:hypothetical protein
MSLRKIFVRMENDAKRVVLAGIDNNCFEF